MHYIIYANMIVGVLLIVLAIPLVSEKIKPNNFYGFRTKKTLSNEKIWYQANKYSGKSMLIAGIIIIAVSIVLIIAFPNLNITENIFIIISLAVLFIPIILAVIMSLFYLKKL